MTFAHPWMLLGALAALIPLLIHLFDRRRPRPHPFGAISFVLRSQRRTASRLRLKRLLLYLLRTTILLALPVALARPELRRASQIAAASRGPAATSIILDASVSMRYTDGTSLFEKGREQARETLRDLMPDEPANVIVCGRSSSSPPSPTFDRSQLRAIIDAAAPTFAGTDLNRCLDLGAHSLEESSVSGKRLVIISDLTANSFRLSLPPPTVTGPKGEKIRPDVVIRDAASGRQTLPNHGLVDLKIEPALQLGPRAFQFSFTVRNFSPDPVKDLEASLKVGDQVVAKGFMDIPPNGAAQKTLRHRFNAGGVLTGEVLITPDNLSPDDRLPFVITVPKDLRALVINGEPSTVRYRDEAFFVEAALNAPGSPVRQTVKDPEAGFREPFDQYELIMLLNVTVPTPEVSRQLVDFVSKGGGLFVSLGDHVDPELYNKYLGDVLPRPLRLVRTSVAPEEPDADRKAAKLGKIVTEHPIFSLFTGRAREGLMSARFYRYMLLEAEASGTTSSEVLATYEDGAPAIAIARRGQGRVLLYTSTVDRDWSDFPIRTSFLPLMQRFSAFLCGSLEEREELRGRVGEPIVLAAKAQEPVGAVRSPSGAELPTRAQEDGSVIVGPLEEPGIHQVLDASGRPIPALTFAAVIDPSESDLTRINPDELSAYFGQEGVVKGASDTQQQHRVPFWSWLIVAAAMAFFFEGVLLRK